MIKRILVGLGGTPFTEVAIQRALELAQRHDAELTGVTVVDARKLTSVGPILTGHGASVSHFLHERLEITVERIKEAVEKFRDACADAGVACNIEQEIGNPFDLMIARARYYDLVVFGLRGLFDYSLVDEPRDILVRLVSQGVRPILAVAPHYRPVRQVLIAYSGSMESAKAMKQFVQLHLWPDASLRIICFTRGKSDASRLLTDATAYCRSHGFTPAIDSLPDTPGNSLLSYAENCKADLIVMGNSVRNLWLRHLLGNTMLQTIQNADLPLFLSQ